MNASQTKLIAWSTAGLLAAGMSGYVFLFFREVDSLRMAVSPDQVHETLDNVERNEEEAKGGVPYAQIRRAMIDLDWTGKPEPVASAGVAEKPPEPPRSTRPVKDLLRVVMIAGDAADPSQSFCVLQYEPSSGVTLESLYQGVRHVGESLHPPLDHIKVESIGPEGVTFSFADASREHEVVGVDEFQRGGGIVALGSEADLSVPPDWSQVRIVSRAGQAPQKTYEYKPDHFRVGTDDAEYIGTHYSEILARDVRTVKHLDPKTGRYDGIEVRSVAQGSVAAQHGVQEGDVIKSINGHPVSSVAQAIQYVKTNADQYDTWEVVVVNKGLEKTVVYKTPDT